MRRVLVTLIVAAIVVAVVRPLAELPGNGDGARGRHDVQHRHLGGGGRAAGHSPVDLPAVAHRRPADRAATADARAAGGQPPPGRRWRDDTRAGGRPPGAQRTRAGKQRGRVACRGTRRRHCCWPPRRGGWRAGWMKRTRRGDNWPPDRRLRSSAIAGCCGKRWSVRIGSRRRRWRDRRRRRIPARFGCGRNARGLPCGPPTGRTPWRWRMPTRQRRRWPPPRPMRSLTRRRDCGWRGRPEGRPGTGAGGAGLCPAVARGGAGRSGSGCDTAELGGGAEPRPGRVCAGAGARQAGAHAGGATADQIQSGPSREPAAAGRYGAGRRAAGGGAAASGYRPRKRREFSDGCGCCWRASRRRSTATPSPGGGAARRSAAGGFGRARSRAGIAAFVMRRSRNGRRAARIAVPPARCAGDRCPCRLPDRCWRASPGYPNRLCGRNDTGGPPGYQAVLERVSWTQPARSVCRLSAKAVRQQYANQLT